MIRIARRYKHRSVIDITSLIDLVFLLVAFFMVTSSIASESSIEVDLPQSVTGADQELETVVISITSENQVFVKDEQIEPEKLGKMFSQRKDEFAEQRIVIRGDKNAHYDTIIQVMDSLNRAGLSKFTLSTVR